MAGVGRLALVRQRRTAVRRRGRADHLQRCGLARVQRPVPQDQAGDEDRLRRAGLSGTAGHAMLHDANSPKARNGASANSVNGDMDEVPSGRSSRRCGGARCPAGATTRATASRSTAPAEATGAPAHRREVHGSRGERRRTPRVRGAVLGHRDPRGSRSPDGRGPRSSRPATL